VLIIITFCRMSKKKISAILPLGFAEQVLDLEVKLEEEEESLELIQILSTMYKVRTRSCR